MAFNHQFSFLYDHLVKVGKCGNFESIKLLFHISVCIRNFSYPLRWQ